MKNRYASILVIIMISVNLIGVIGFTSENAKAEVFGPNVRVDDTGLGISTQRYPSIAVNPNDGDIYVVWDDNRNGNYDIYFSKSADGGLSFGTNVRADDTGASSSVQSYPTIAVSTLGEIYAVWHDSRNGDFDIYFAKSSDGGISFSPNIRVDDTGAGGSSQQYPSIAVNASGEICVAWMDNRDGGLGVYFAKSTNGGLSFNANVRVDDIGAVLGLQENPGLAIDNSGRIFVAWEDLRNGNVDIYFAKSTDGGFSFDANVRVDDTGLTSALQLYPSIAVDTNGIISAVWADDRNIPWNFDIYYAKSIDGGLSFGTNIRVDDTGLDSTSTGVPTIATDDNDIIYVAWDDNRTGNYDIYFSKSANGGVSFEPNDRVDDTGTDTFTQIRPAIAVEDNGNVSIVWHDSRNGNYDIYYSKGIIPNNPPTCTISSPSDDDVVSGTISITGTASDSDGTVQLVEIKIDSGSWSPATGTASWTYSFDTATLSDGDHTISARSYDGENYSVTVSVVVKVDNVNEAPTITVTSPSEGATVSGTINITGSASDPDDDSELISVEVKVDSDSWQTATGTTSWFYSLDTSTLSDGQHVLCFRSYDGSEYSSERQVNITVDNAGPGDGDGKSIFEELWFWALIVVIIVVVVLMLLVAVMRKRGGKKAEDEQASEDMQP